MKWTAVAFHPLNLTFWISGLRISLGPFSNLSMFIALEVRKGGRKGKEGVEEVAMKQNKKVFRATNSPKDLKQRISPPACTICLSSDG